MSIETDVKGASEAVKVELEVGKEMPSRRDAELFARELFLVFAGQLGPTADRRNVEQAWIYAEQATEVYLAKITRISGIHDREKQQRIRRKLILK